MIKTLTQSAWSYVTIAIFYMIGLWGASVPLTGDQKVYLSIALEMRERAEWIIPYLFQEPNFLKPPFQYWMTLLGWKFFGLSIFGALVPSVLALLCVSRLCNRLLLVMDRRKDYLPGVFFAAALGTMTYGTTAQMEIWIVLFYFLSWLLFLDSKRYWALATVGVMAWIKGPLYPVLWVLSVVLYFFLKGKKREIIDRKFMLPLLLGTLMGLLWFGVASIREWELIQREFLLQENLGKLGTSQGSPLGLWGAFLYSLLPWVFWWVLSLADSQNRNRIKASFRTWLPMVLIPAVFFTFFPYRVNTYLYLLTPVAVYFLLSHRIESSRVSRMIAALVTVVSAVLLFFVFRLTEGNWIGIELGIPLIVVVLLWGMAHWKREPRWIALTALLMVNLIRMGAVQIGEKNLVELREWRQKNDAPLAYYRPDQNIWHEFGMVSAAMGERIFYIDQESGRNAFLRSGGVIILDPTQTELADRLSCEPWSRLRRRVRFPLKRLVLEGIPWGHPDLMQSYVICKMKV